MERDVISRENLNQYLQHHSQLSNIHSLTYKLDLRDIDAAPVPVNPAKIPCFLKWIPVSNDCTIQITFDKADDKIQLIKGGVVNLIGDKYRFKLDEQGDVGGILNRQETMWNDVTISVDNNTNTVCGIITDFSGFVIAEPINSDWREVWTGENSPGGTGITTTELQDAIHHWLDDISIRGHILTTADLQEIIAIWLLE